MNVPRPHGGPVFPVQDVAKCQCLGITLRDYFAAAALQGLCASGEASNAPVDSIVMAAYQLADAMLKEQEANQ